MMEREIRRSEGCLIAAFAGFALNKCRTVKGNETLESYLTLRNFISYWFILSNGIVYYLIAFLFFTLIYEIKNDSALKVGLCQKFLPW